MKNIKLTVQDRILLDTLLPRSGNLETMIVTSSIVEMMKFSAEEKQNIDLEIKGDTYTWNDTKEEVLEYQLTERQAEILINVFRHVDNTSKVDYLNLSLITKLSLL